jgi:hypothetical protein
MSFAQSEESVESPFPAATAPTKSYKFQKADEKPAKEGKAPKEPLGTLKVLEQKNLVRLEFEGRGLEKGNYQIIKTASCEVLKKRLLSNKPIPADALLFAFDTEYGNISTEKNFNGQKLDSLGLEATALALIKIEKHGDRFIACGQ